MSGSAHQRTTLAEARAARMERPAAAEAYEQASPRFGLAEAARREELGLSQPQLAGMTQTGVARLEAGGTTPTIPVLGRLASALGLQLTISLGPDERCSASDSCPISGTRFPAMRSRGPLPPGRCRPETSFG